MPSPLANRAVNLSTQLPFLNLLNCKPETGQLLPQRQESFEGKLIRYISLH